jgi:hypothetical protein
MDKEGKMKKKPSCAKSKLRSSVTRKMPVSFIEIIFQRLLLHI